MSVIAKKSSKSMLEVARELVADHPRVRALLGHYSQRRAFANTILTALSCAGFFNEWRPEEREIIEAAKNHVALWKQGKIAGLPRPERNAALEETRQRLINAVDSLSLRPGGSI